MLQLRRKGTVLTMAITALLTAVLGVGLSTPALAEDDVTTYEPDKAMLTKVIVAPTGTDAAGDSYVFHFAGGGAITESEDKLYSDGVEQDKTTLKKDDVVPTIEDVTLTGINMADGNTLSNGQSRQAVVQKSITTILNDQHVTFPHAGVYTYVVTEKSTTTALTDGTYINASQAQYTLRIRVQNEKTENASVLGNRGLVVQDVTVERNKDDDGNGTSGKVDPTYPTVDSNGKIALITGAQAPEPNKLAGDARGREVPGFTFANEYIKGGSFQVKKLYDGPHSDRTKYSLVELAIYSEAAANPNAHGACATYVIEGEGIDETEYNQDSDGERLRLNGIKQDLPQTNHYMAKFKDNGWCYIKAELKEGSLIRITGEFGPYNAEYESQNEYGNRRMVLSTSGLLQGQTYYVIEREPGDYVPTGYEYVGEDNADPRVNPSSMTATTKRTTSMIDETDPIPDDQPYYTQKTIEAGELFVKGTATGSATTVFVVNTLNESEVSPTGIFIDNLPYILMIGIPIAVLGGMFANRLRKNVVV